MLLIKMTTEMFLFVFNIILIAIFLPLRRANMKFRYGLCSSVIASEAKQSHPASFYNEIAALPDGRSQ